MCGDGWAFGGAFAPLAISPDCRETAENSMLILIRAQDSCSRTSPNEIPTRECGERTFSGHETQDPSPTVCDCICRRGGSRSGGRI